LDLGYAGAPISSSTESVYNDDLLAAAGIGLDIQTYYDFVIRFEFSVNREGQTGFFVNLRSSF
jgi:hypothetical protein